MTAALKRGSLDEARAAAAMLNQTFEAFRLDPESWRSVAPESLVENSVDLFTTTVTSLHQAQLFDWMCQSLQPQLARWVDRFDEGLSMALETIPEARATDVLIRMAARGRTAIDAVLAEAAEGQANASALAHPVAMGLAVTSLKGLQGVLKALRFQIKAITAQQSEERTDAARNFQRLSLLLTVTFVTLMVVRISAVVLGGLLLTQPPVEEGLNGLAVGRLALNTTNLATTFAYERLRERRASSLAKRALLAQERAELKKALFRSQDWTTALQTLQSLGEDQRMRRALCPANLTAGLTAIERIQRQQRQGGPPNELPEPCDEIPSRVGGGPPLRRAATQPAPTGLNQTAIVETQFRVEMFEQQAKVLAEAMSRFMDPMRDVIQACAWVCEGIPTGSESKPAAMATVAGILERHLIMLRDYQQSGVALVSGGQRLLKSAFEVQRSCCGSNSSRVVQVLTQLLDYGFAASAWISGGVEAFASLDESRSKQMLFATAVIDALNSGTAPLRELFFNRAETYQSAVLQLSQALASVEGILPLAEAAGRAFQHIGQALHDAADEQEVAPTSEELMERIGRSARVAQQIGQLALILTRCPPDDAERGPLEARITELVHLLDQLVVEPTASVGGGDAAAMPTLRVGPNAGESRETHRLNQALAEAVLLPEERGASTGERPMPNLVVQLRRATQRAELAIHATQSSRPRVFGSSDSPDSATSSRRESVRMEPRLLLREEQTPWPSLGPDSVSFDMRVDSSAWSRSGAAECGSSTASRVTSTRALQLWGLARRSYRLLAAQAFLERGGWRGPVIPGQEGLRLASLLRAALIVSSAQVLRRYQQMTGLPPRVPAHSATRAVSPARNDTLEGGLAGQAAPVEDPMERV